LAFTIAMQALPVGNMLPMRCFRVERMFFIPDGRSTVRCCRGGDMTELAPGGRDCLNRPVAVQHELHNAGGMDCQVQTRFSPSPSRRPRYHDLEPLALQAAVPQPATV
jgi:hypothetical protein